MGFMRGTVANIKGKWVRVIEPPLIEKGKARVGRLRLYGDAICVPAAEAFVRAYLESEGQGIGNREQE